MKKKSESQRLFEDPSARTIVAGELEAVFLPGYGMRFSSTYSALPGATSTVSPRSS